jgi:hypothetical protein
MPTADFLSQNNRLFSQQMLNFKVVIPDYAAVLGITAGEMTAQAADADRYKWELDAQDICRQCSQSWGAWTKITRKGGDFPVAGAPVDIELPAPEPTAVDPGIEPRFRALVRKCKENPNYNQAIGEALGIHASAAAGPDFNTLHPLLKLGVFAAGVSVGWDWGGYSGFLDSIELRVDRGDGQGEKLLTIDTTPGYNDTQALPAAPQKWTYRGCYRVGDQLVGQWSASVSVNVGG